MNWSENKQNRYYEKHWKDYQPNQFTKRQLKQIRKMKSGEIIWFKEAAVVSPDCKPNSVYIDLKFTITE